MELVLTGYLATVILLALIGSASPLEHQAEGVAPAPPFCTADTICNRTRRGVRVFWRQALVATRYRGLPTRRARARRARPIPQTLELMHVPQVLSRLVVMVMLALGQGDSALEA